MRRLCIASIVLDTLPAFERPLAMKLCTSPLLAREHDPDAGMAARLAQQSICDGYSASSQMRKTTPASIRKPWSDPSL